MNGAPPISTAEEQNALATLRTRRLVLFAVGTLIVILAGMMVVSAYRAMDRTAHGLDPVILLVR